MPLDRLGDNKTTIGGKTPRERVAELYREHEKQLLRRLVSKAGSEQEARDVVQETFARLLSLDELEKVRAFGGYLWKTACNIVWDRKRASSYRDARLKIMESEPVASSPSPEPALIAREELALIQEAMEELPPKCRRAFELRIVDELPLELVAQEMQLDVSGVKKYVGRAVVHCRQAINSVERKKGRLK